MIQITNTLTGKKEPFTPIEPGKVKMYVCGPTVYNFIHIGNARPLVFFDVVGRYLKFSGFSVTRVMNYTDVDDKIIQKANEEKVSCETVTQKYIAEFEEDMKLLKVEQPDAQPKVTGHIPEIIKMIETLIAKGSAYVAADGEVFFSVRSFPQYGKLSKKKIDDLLVGARVAPDEKKKDPLDFSLWKPRKNEKEPAWDSPWGPGRPGWHIECSAMSIKYLGETFDIHGGGMDLMHPHHENEIAQSEGATAVPFCNYWVHNNLLTINSEKMSKSLGNIWLTRDFIKRFTAETLKFFLLSGHYRSTLDFSESQVREHQAALHRIYKALEKAHKLTQTDTNLSQPLTTEGNTADTFGKAFGAHWKEAMDDDFNTARVFGLVFDYVRVINAFVDKKGFKWTVEAKNIVNRFLSDMKTLSGVLNLFAEEPTAYLQTLRLLFLAEKGMSEAQIKEAILKRITARADKDFSLADQIRNDLLANGIELMDRGNETDWDVKFTG
ncbi:MAG: cysteine--tRNA ligase [Proteobacteria bacterium]|nr:cysteine--tRNA ligase [Pseudomonadota bacterium]